MSDAEIVAHLKLGGVGNFGYNSRNMSVINLMNSLEAKGLVELKDVSTSQETRFEVRWIGSEP